MIRAKKSPRIYVEWRQDDTSHAIPLALESLHTMFTRTPSLTLAVVRSRYGGKVRGVVCVSEFVCDRADCPKCPAIANAIAALNGLEFIDEGHIRQVLDAVVSNLEVAAL